jgi:GGDEF domain-containing protein
MNAQAKRADVSTSSTERWSEDFMISIKKYLDMNGALAVEAESESIAPDAFIVECYQSALSATRAVDRAGRWGGDEFVVILACDTLGASVHIERMKKWVLGKYTIQVGAGTSSAFVCLDAAIEFAEWHPGETMQQVIVEADAAMYRDKSQALK